MTETQPDTGAKVSLALISKQQEDMDKKIDYIILNLDKIRCDVIIIDKAQAVTTEKVKTQGEEIEKLRNVNTIWSSMNTIIALIASGIGLNR